MAYGGSTYGGAPYGGTTAATTSGPSLSGRAHGESVVSGGLAPMAKALSGAAQGEATTAGGLAAALLALPTARAQGESITAAPLSLVRVLSGGKAQGESVARATDLIRYVDFAGTTTWTSELGGYLDVPTPVADPPSRAVGIMARAAVSAGATSVPLVEPLEVALAVGATVAFAGGTTVTLSAAAKPGDLSLTVNPVP